MRFHLTTKQCSRCKAVKELHEFHNDKNRPDGKYPQCKACGAEYAKARRESGAAGPVQTAWRAQARKGPRGRASRLLADAKQRANGAGLPCTITLDWVTERIAAGVCAATSLPFDLEGSGAPARPFTPSLDRIDPSQGYTPENTQVVAWVYNRAKGVHDHAAVMKMAEALCNRK
jgi:hypothetical protein